MSVFKSACRVGQSVAGPLVKAKLPIVLCTCVLSASVEYMLVRSSSTPSAVGTQTSARANFNHTTSHSAVCASASVPHQLHPFSKNMCRAYSPHHHPSRFARLFPSPAFQLSGSLGSDGISWPVSFIGKVYVAAAILLLLRQLLSGTLAFQLSGSLGSDGM
jgi:hypothetical protein